MDMCSTTQGAFGMSPQDWLFMLIIPLLKILFILGVVIGLYTPLATLVERKLSAAMQDRIGPNRAYIFKLGGRPVTIFGLFHTMADALKMFAKEWVTPAGADKFLF